jgi:hypothetical protein
VQVVVPVVGGAMLDQCKPPNCANAYITNNPLMNMALAPAILMLEIAFLYSSELMSLDLFFLGYTNLCYTPTPEKKNGLLAIAQR